MSANPQRPDPDAALPTETQQLLFNVEAAWQQALVRPGAPDGSPLRMADDADLWQILQRTFAPERYEQMSALLDRKRREGLSVEEQQMLDHLVREYEAYVIQRSQAAAFLQMRGYDIVGEDD